MNIKGRFIQVLSLVLAIVFGVSTFDIEAKPKPATSAGRHFIKPKPATSAHRHPHPIKSKPASSAHRSGAKSNIDKKRGQYLNHVRRAAANSAHSHFQNNQAAAQHLKLAKKSHHLNKKAKRIAQKRKLRKKRRRRWEKKPSQLQTNSVPVITNSLPVTNPPANP